MEITLQQPTSADFSFIEWLWGDLATTEVLGGPFSFPEEMRMDWLKSKSQASNAYFIIKKGIESVGEVSFRDFEKGIAHLNIKVAACYRGQRIAQKALQLFLDFFQTDRGGIVMLDEVRRKNEAGIGFLVKAGFEVIEEKEWTVVLKWSAQAEGSFE
ncbi:GNAT family N-acetyltransferase [Listeria monocytogenes]|uniref:GNAT family N-acetyltransferase n=1 Tax=Listeria monocytogenes TaxID=1639 RepID=UPI00053BF4D0|nr:N-acetyltransferase [Listeria monocytogenes]EAE3729074.1 N-acetyltransferase [Listeria monocytogenes serotype 1/2a]EAF4501581.1 N-acetyltransferase [Listeria monocytogenes serotype 4b]EHC6202435.1 GNAT family N-acetyltransferase [Listeria monocytogenes serotype 1/2c]AYY78231.1 N-acetyltransferase [Listeria monocytogenes]EAC2130551.1 N-acetyltransferase [Listeria monocytogenes]